MRRLAAAISVALGLWPAFAPAEGQPMRQGIPQSAVVVLDRDALYSGSLFGQRVARDIEAASQELARENRRIEQELQAEERDLTERRATLPAEEFRALAGDFDARVTEIRETQDAKARAIAQQSERAQQLFLERANPILVDLARETGALVILDRRFVLASADQVDITALAAQRIDAVLGEGGDIGNAPPGPRPDAPLAAPEASPDPAD